jgi:hypothetical protein
MAEADRGRCGRVGACGFTTAGTLVLDFRRRNRFRRARLNCPYVSDGDTGNIVRQVVDRLDVETTANTDLFQALCHTGGGACTGRVRAEQGTSDF